MVCTLQLETVDNTAVEVQTTYTYELQVETLTFIATAGGALKVGEAVKFDASAELVADTTILAGEVAVGRYIAHENEEATPTDAVDGDVIIVRLGL